MSSKVNAAAIVGLSGEHVEVEVDVLGAGLHNFTLVGLPDTAVKESRDRVSSALKNAGFKPPHQLGRITVNLAPADLPKSSPIYDVPIAIGILLATKQLQCQVSKKLFVGELALDGMVRRINGVLPIVLYARDAGYEEVYVPAENVKEASVVDDIAIIPITNILALAKHLKGTSLIEPVGPIAHEDLFSHLDTVLDMADVKGHKHAKRALEIAAAGGHNVIFNGPPGSGKTLLAKTFVSLLPRLTLQEALDITKIYSVAGLLNDSQQLIVERPFRSPHNTASSASLIGGGTHPRPGEISLAHRGVLFLDEFAEFPRAVIENLRQPLEDGVVTVARAKGSLTFPAHFILVAAMNPCPCGFLTDDDKQCTCTPSQVARYSQKISGPILDRIDMHIDVPRVSITKLEDSERGESSSMIRERVETARRMQRTRFESEGIVTNAEMSNQQMKNFAPLDEVSTALLRAAAEKMQFSARTYHRIIKLARTIADLAGSEKIEKNHLAEAIQYRASK